MSFSSGIGSLLNPFKPQRVPFFPRLLLSLVKEPLNLGWGGGGGHVPVDVPPYTNRP